MVDAWPIMLEATAIKTVDEINCFKTVAAICEAGWFKAWQTLRPGIRDTELSRIVIPDPLRGRCRGRALRCEFLLRTGQF